MRLIQTRTHTHKPVDLHDFSTAQANDLAKHFLGDGWAAARLVSGIRMLRDSNRFQRPTFQGATWREAFRAAGIALPPYRNDATQFSAHETRVLLGQQLIANAVSGTMAKRIARALNVHKPDARGV